MNALELRRRTLGKGVYKKTVEGNPAIAQGSLARMYPGITLQGWTEQNQYEGKNLFDISKFQSGTTNINNGDGSITLTAYAVNINNKISDVLPDVKTGDVLYTSATNGTLIYIGGKVLDINQDKSIEITDEVLENNTFGFYGSNDREITISDIMISKAYETPYEPYTGGQPSPNPDYPQPITSAGKWNEETQKWEYEITIANEQTAPDKNQTVTLTADRPLTKWDRLEKRNGQWGWVYKSAEIVLDGDESVGGAGGAVMTTIPFIINGIKGVPNSEGTIVTFSDKLQGILNSNWNNGNAQGVYLMNDGRLGVRINASYLSTSERSEYAQAFKEWLSENNVKVLYETAEETFTPLSETEQELMNELYTFRPTTILSNDCDCDMTLTYKTKKSLEVTT